jgi:hypothetical protein
VRFAEGGAAAMDRSRGPDAATRHRHLPPGETLVDVLAEYGAVARHRRVRRHAATYPAGRPVPPWQRALRALLTSTVITLALFRQMSNHAGVVARGHVEDLVDPVPDLPDDGTIRRQFAN